MNYLKLMKIKSIYIGAGSFVAIFFLFGLINKLLNIDWTAGPLIVIYLLAFCAPGYIAAEHAGKHGVAHGFFAGFFSILILTPIGFAFFGYVGVNGEPLNIGSFLLISLGVAFWCSLGGLAWETKKHFTKQP